MLDHKAEVKEEANAEKVWNKCIDNVCIAVKKDTYIYIKEKKRSLSLKYNLVFSIRLI